MTLIQLKKCSKSDGNTRMSFISFKRELTKKLATKITCHKRSYNKLDHMNIDIIYLILKTKQNFKMI